MNKSLTKLVYGVKPWDLSKLFLKETSAHITPHNLLRMLSEAIIDDLIVKYPYLEEVLLQVKIDIDPKYHRWFVKTYDRYTDNKIDQELYQELVRLLKSFKELSDKKKIKGSESDIEKYKTIEDLKAVIERSSQEKSRTEKTKDEVDYLLRDDRFIVALPKTHAASCKLGSNTPWCVSTLSNDSYWSNYTEQYEIHFVMIIDKKPTEPRFSKVAVAVSEQTGKYEIYDVHDEEVDVSELQEAWGDRFQDVWELVTGSNYNIISTSLKKLIETEIKKQLSEQYRYSSKPVKPLDREDVRANQDALGTVAKSIVKLDLKQKNKAMFALSNHLASEAEKDIGEIPDKVAETIMFLGSDPQKSVLYAVKHVPNELLVKWLISFKKEFDLISKISSHAHINHKSFF